MPGTIVFETHATSEDNGKGLATGWAQGRLSAAGREQARRLGDRRRDDDISAVFVSDLRRAAQTATIAFEGTSIPMFMDWRLRECDYGDMTRMPVSDLHSNRADHLDDPYPGGESWRQAIDRVGGLLDDLRLRWDGARVLIVGHVATRWALDHRLGGRRLEDLVCEDFNWQEGWEYPT